MSFSRITGWGTGALISLMAAAVSPISLMAVAQEPDVIAPHNEPGVIGELKIGQTAAGELAGTGESEAAGFHTYTVEVPEGTDQLIVEMTAAADLDLGIKHGEPIIDYGIGADWDMGDDSLEPSATLTVNDPEAGIWYIDVIHGLYNTESVPYELQVR